MCRRINLVLMPGFGSNESGDNQKQESCDLQHQQTHYSADVRNDRAATSEEAGDDVLALTRCQQTVRRTEAGSRGTDGARRLVSCHLLSHA